MALISAFKLMPRYVAPSHCITLLTVKVKFHRALTADSLTYQLNFTLISFQNSFD